LPEQRAGRRGSDPDPGAAPVNDDLRTRLLERQRQVRVAAWIAFGMAFIVSNLIAWAFYWLLGPSRAGLVRVGVTVAVQVLLASARLAAELIAIRRGPRFSGTDSSVVEIRHRYSGAVIL